MPCEHKVARTQVARTQVARTHVGRTHCVRGGPPVPSAYVALLRQLLDFLYPPHCYGCGRATQVPEICRACERTIERPTDPMCPTCGAPYAGATSNHGCPSCQRRRPGFATARATAILRPEKQERATLRRLIHDFKYRRDVTLAAPLGSRMARLVISDRLPRGLVVPVPLHVKRLRWRGFNQAQLLARSIARPAGLEVDARVLVRSRDTPPQVGLDARRRVANVAGAFEVADPTKVRARNILLVDDVMTTGATADACARALRSAGAKRVDVLALARAIGD